MSTAFPRLPQFLLFWVMCYKKLTVFLAFSAGKGYDPSGNYSDYTAFREWLQCYYNPEMRNLVDRDGRTMWFKVCNGYVTG